MMFTNTSIIGYTTGTFDFVHEGHFRLLKNIKARCTYLIVGLTTDELACKQKRKPVMCYDNRRSILEHCKYVDSVVAHNGLSKQDDYKKLKFHILFIGDDYFGNAEYKLFTDTPVIYIPRTLGISTSKLIAPICANPEIIAFGIFGPVFKLNSGTIIKYVNVGWTEFQNTSDAYKLPIPRPRNWKQNGSKHIHPNIPGVNSNRELVIHDMIPKVWNPVLVVKQIWQSDNPNKSGNLVQEHNNPYAVYSIEQRDAGETLKSWWINASKLEKKRIINRVHTITTEMQELKVIHGDLHASNVCVDKFGVVSILDFGWCQHESFSMSKEETALYTQRLESFFDWTHFVKSLEWDGLFAELATYDKV